jgi:hypothetical protein
MKIEKILKEKEYGIEDGAILLDQAYHGCDPETPCGWCAPAIKDNQDGTYEIGYVWWDFEEWVSENGHQDDDSNYPWEGAGIFYNECQGLTLNNNLEEILNWIE